MRARTIISRGGVSMSRSLISTLSGGGNGNGTVIELLKSRIDDIPEMEAEELSRFIEQIKEQPTEIKSQFAKALTETQSKRKEMGRYVDVMIGVTAFGVYMATPIPFWLAGAGGGGAWYFLNESSKEAAKRYSLVQTQLINSLSVKH